MSSVGQSRALSRSHSPSIGGVSELMRDPAVTDDAVIRSRVQSPNAVHASVSIFAPYSSLLRKSSRKKTYRPANEASVVHPLGRKGCWMQAAYSFIIMEDF